MESIQQRYGIPPSVAEFLTNGFLEVVSEEPDRKTVEFHIPALRRTDERGRIRTYSLVWIHPDFNAQFCHYYESVPGDAANFYVDEDETDVGGTGLDLASVDELVAWLEGMKETADAG
ncbi:MAG: hypothetical protein ACKVP0_22635 [Pirellulaceae bacterium]